MHRPWLRAFVVFVVVAATAWLGWRLGRSHAPAQHSADSAAAAFEAESAHTTQAADPIRKRAPELGRAQVQQPDRYAQLLAAVNRGDANAAYQLAKAREACLRLQGSENLLRMLEESLRSQSDAAKQAAADKKVAAQISETRDEIVRLRDACAGPEHVSRAELHDAWARAAQLGSPDAQYEFALDPRLNPLSIGTDTERWKQWRDAAPRYLNDLLDKGEPRAALALAAGSDQGDCTTPDNTPSEADVCRNSGMVSLILPQDPSIAYLYYLLDQMLGDSTNAAWVTSELARLAQSLSAEEIAAARNQAQRRFAQLHSAK